VPLNLYAPVSRRLVSDVRTEQYLCEIVDAFSLGMTQMHLQLTRALVDDWSSALQDALQTLRAAEFRFVLTDVESQPEAETFSARGFDELHLARRLTNAAATDASARRVVSEIARIAHDRAVLVTATGVDDRPHRDALLETGCDRATGALYGRPEPTNAID
jgi:EAL domain-containing protein (putative c-di-GMP-specific phosphodiesterase class I)